jgi:protein phosphatase PTC1
VSDIVHCPALRATVALPFLTSKHTYLRVSFSPSENLAGNKRRSLSSQGGLLLNRMFGGGSNSKPDPSAQESAAKADNKKPPSPDSKADSASSPSSASSSNAPAIKSPDHAASGEKRSGNGSPPGRHNADTGGSEKKRRSSSVSSKASSLIASAKNSLNFSQVSRTNSEMSAQTPLQKLGKQDQSLAVPQGQHNNSAGESLPGPRSTFRVGVWEDRNKKCRRTMEDTHAFLYNFLHTPAPQFTSEGGSPSQKSRKSTESSEQAPPPSQQSPDAGQDMNETDNGYFAIFDGHAGTFAADWCGKKLHLILEETIRKNPNVPIPEL